MAKRKEKRQYSVTPFGFSRLRRVGGQTSSMVLTVPAPEARQLQHLIGRIFRVELTEAGILFRPMPEGVDPVLNEPDVPVWAGEDDGRESNDAAHA